MNTEQIETSIVQLGESSPTEALLAAGDTIARLKEFVKEVSAAWEEKMIAHIGRVGPVECGTIRWYVGNKKTTKCMDVPGTVEALLTAVGGDFDRFCEHLSSGAVKYGEAKKTLPPERYAELFIVTDEPELKEGVPVKKLQRVDTKYLK